MAEVLETLLEVRNLHTHAFAHGTTIHAVDGVNFSLRRGETLGLVGESGSGKSMTCLSLVRLVPPSSAEIVSGEILFQGANLLTLSKAEMRSVRGRHIAMILQDPMASLNPALTIGEQIAEPLRLHRKLSKADVLDESIEALRRMHISWPQLALTQYPHSLSGGMRQRVAGAIALAGHPEILIADEPTTSLDVTIQAEYLNLLREIQRTTELAIIFVTHDFGIVANICDRVAVMYAGRIVEIGPVEKVFANPAHPYTEALLASIPRVDQRDMWLRTIEGQPAVNEGEEGCPFATRCSYVQDRCWSEYPSQTQRDSDHFVSCWRWSNGTNARDESMDEIAAASRRAKKQATADTIAKNTHLAAPLTKRNKHSAVIPPREVGPQQRSISAQPLIDICDVVKHFPIAKGILRRKTVGLIKAVDGISFSLRRGSTISIVGESGCGKTTLNKLVLALETPTQGQVLYEGRNVHQLKGQELKRYRRAVQAVFQDPWSSMNPRMKVKKFVAEPILVNESTSRAERDYRVAQVLEQVGLEASHSERFPHEFSGGQRQRVCIARALAVHPALVVLDEPVSGLDVSIQAQILNLLKQIQTRQGVSYILVSHNLATVRFMSDQIAVMYLGEVVETGLAESVFSKPLHPYTQALMASALPADPKKRTEVGIVGEVPSPLDIPNGCRFHTRCPFAMQKCATIAPETKRMSSDHQVSCHLYE